MSDRNDWNNQMIAEFRAKGGKNVGPFGDNLLLLSTVGAKSGATRVNPIAFTRDGDRFVIIASKGGAPTNPDWYYNLVRNPVTTIDVGAETIPVRAVEVKGEERDRLYQNHSRRFPGFIEYQEKTSRKIPVFVLERIAP